MGIITKLVLIVALSVLAFFLSQYIDFLYQYLFAKNIDFMFWVPAEERNGPLYGRKLNSFRYANITFVSLVLYAIFVKILP